MRRWHFSGPASGPRLLISGGVHGDEYEPIAALWQLIDLLEQRDGGLSLVRGDLTLIPVVNEAAFALRQRTAEDGLDLARTCPGSQAGSVTERAAWEISQQIRAADYYIDLHTGGTALAILPMSGYTLHPNQAVLDRQRQMALEFNLPIVWGTTPDLPGRTLSVARDANVPAIYAEHGGGGGCQRGGVDDYRQGCLNVLAWLGMIPPPATKVPPRVTRVVEDPRPDSGHLQLCHQAPIAGYFQPAVALGAEITQGAPIGTVTTLDRQLHPIHATQTGLLLALRTQPSVQPGEPLAVVQESPPPNS